MKQFIISVKTKLAFYITFCFVGAGLEWAYGTFWDICGTTPWIYPGSLFRYTTLEIIPLWGFGGLVFISIYEALKQRAAKLLIGMMLPLALALLWIVLYTQIILK